MIIATRRDLEAAIAQLSEREARFAALAEDLGLPPLRRIRGSFEALVDIIVEQMISLHAARAILARLKERVVPFSPHTIHAMSADDLCGLGLSRAKARTIKGLADAIDGGKLDLRGLGRLEDDAVRAALTSLTGIGPWTAEIYILAALGRSDAWPAHDVALQSAVKDVFSLTERPDARVMADIAEPWQPWRAVAARLLWSHYRRMRGLPQRV